LSIILLLFLNRRQYNTTPTIATAQNTPAVAGNAAELLPFLLAPGEGAYPLGALFDEGMKGAVGTDGVGSVADFTDGIKLGIADGVGEGSVSFTDGLVDGMTLGVNDGETVVEFVSFTDGMMDGIILGISLKDGVNDGCDVAFAADGNALDTKDGDNDPSTLGFKLGTEEGKTLGAEEGNDDGLVVLLLIVISSY